MQLLVADGHGKETLAVIQKHGWGRMVSTDQNITPYEGEPWGFDNGAWKAFVDKTPFDTEKFLKRVNKMQKVGAPILAVTPDIVAGGMKSLNFSNEWITKLANGWSWYLAVQDGMDFESVEKSLETHPYAGIFLGGSNRFKSETDLTWAKIAKKHKIKFHYGRCGTAPKIRKAYRIGADSCDSAFPHWIKKGCWTVILKAISAEESIRHKNQCKIDRICGHQEWLGFLAASCAKNNDLNNKECFPHKPLRCPKIAFLSKNETVKP